MKRNMKWKLCSVLTVFALMAAMIAMPVKAAATGGADLEEDSSQEFIVKSDQSGHLNLMGYTQSGKIVIEKGGELTINGPGKISVETYHAIENSGKLTINGNVEVDALSHAKAALYNQSTGVVTINGGTFLRSKENGKGAADSGGNSYYNIRNLGNMTFNGGAVTQNGRYSSLVANLGNASKVAEMTINGGTFSGGINTIKNDDYGSLIINGGTFGNVTQAPLMNWNVAKVTGGTFNSDREAVINGKLENAMNKGDLTITGGTFNSGDNRKIIAKHSGATSLGNVNVTGGSYNSDLGVSIEKEYKIVVENGRNVVKAKVPAITLSETNVSMELGATKTLTATRADKIEGDIVWTSSNPEVATVTNGVIKTVKAGVTTITVTADGKVATCEVQVVKPLEKPVLPTPPVNDGKDTTIEVNEKTTEVLTDTIKEIVNNVEAATGVSEETKTALKKAISEGKQISVEAKTEKVDAKKVEATVVKEVEKVIAKDAMIAQYFDLSMMIKAEGTDLGTMNELSSKASFTVSVPTDLTKEGRTFYMVRIHEGVAEKIAGTLKGNEFTFESDKFSLFALVYEDGKVEVPTTPDKPATPATPEKPGVDTGDTTATTSLLVMMGTASLILSGLLLRKKLEKQNK